MKTVRKNMYIRQAALDEARTALGAKTETETVDLALAMATEMAAFRTAMLAGFDALMAGGLRLQHTDKDLDFSGFAKRVPTAKA